MYVLYKCNGMNAYIKMWGKNQKSGIRYCNQTFKKSSIHPQLALCNIVACAEYYNLGLHKRTARR
jgi:hypothetical protein